MRGSIKTANAYWNMNTLTPVIPAGAQMNHLRPLGGEKVHWTFSCFRLSSRWKREFFSNLLASACAGTVSIPLENRSVLPN